MMDLEPTRVVSGRVRLLWGATVLLLAGAGPATGGAQQAAPAAPALVFDGVTVVDVEQGKLMPNRRVVIAGNRIQAVESGRAVPVLKGARVVDARGKYLIPGLWDMHAHVQAGCQQEALYPRLIASGVTGIRDLNVASLDTALRWRREVASGARVGPRAVISGPALDGSAAFAGRLQDCAGRPQLSQGRQS